MQLLRAVGKLLTSSSDLDDHVALNDGASS